MKTIFLFLFFLFFTVFAVKAQQAYLQHYSEYKELGVSDIYSIHQDRENTLWLGSDRGLLRIDGQKVEHFGPSELLPSGFVSHIVEDSRGYLWFLFYPSGLCFWDGKRMQKPLLDSAAALLINKGQIASLHWQDSALYFCLNRYAGFDPQPIYNKGLYRLEGGKIERVDSLFAPAAQPFQSPFIKQLNDSVYLHESYAPPLGRTSYPQKENNSFLAQGDSLGLFLHNSRYRFCKQLSDGSLICFASFGYIHIKGEQVLAFDFFPEGQIPLTLYETRNKQLYLGTSAGAFFYPSLSLKQKAERRFLQGYAVSDILEDEEGACYFSCLEQGLFIWDASRPELLHQEPSGKEQIVGFAQGANNLYAWNNKGILLSWSAENKKICEHRELENRHAGIIKAIFAIPLDKEENSYLQRVEQFQESNWLKTYSFLSTIALRNIYSQGDSLWLFGHSQGFLVFNKAGEIVFNSSRELGFRAWTEAFYLDKRNQYWIGSMDGLYRYHVRNGFEKIEQEQFPALNFRITTIRGLAERDVIFFASHGGALLLRYKGRWQRIGKEQGLKGSYINDIALQGDSVLWLATEQGLDYLHYAFLNDSIGILEYRQLSAPQVFPHKEIKALKLLGDSLHIACKSAWFLLNTQRVSPCPFPQVRIKSWQLGKELLDKNTKELISLEHGHSDWQIELSAQSFCASQIYYRSFLEGLDTETRLSSYPLLRYSNLKPGYYRLRISAAAEDLVFGPELSVYVYIAPAFYQTWWFLWIGLLLCLFGALGLYRYNQYKQQRKRELIMQEIKSLRAQMNPHFLFNAMNSIAFFIAKNEKRSALDYLTKFSQLLRKVVEHSRKHSVSWAEEKKLLSLYLDLEAIRLQNFSYQIDIAHSEHWQLPPLLIQPLVENALVHGLAAKKGEKTLHISSKMLGKEAILVEILDTGIGRKASQEIHKKRHIKRESTGLANIIERLESLSAIYKQEFSMQIQDPEEGGTRIVLHLAAMNEDKQGEDAR